MVNYLCTPTTCIFRITTAFQVTSTTSSCSNHLPTPTNGCDSSINYTKQWYDLINAHPKWRIFSASKQEDVASFLRKSIVIVKFLVCYYCSLYLVTWFLLCLFVFLHTFFLDNLCITTRQIWLGLFRQVTLLKDHLSIKTTLLWPKGGRLRQVSL